MVKLRRLSFLALMISAMTATAAVDTMSGTFDPMFKSLQIEVEGSPYAPDVITLGEESDRIVVSFDELSEERRYMRYRLVHCDRNWQPEGLVDSEFLDGFNETEVSEWAYSEATLVHYVHYTIRIPDGQMRITQPGNYLVQVYDESDPDTVLLQARFGVCDYSMRAGAEVTSRTDVDTNSSHQQLSVTVDTRSADVRDPYSDITVEVSQNARIDNAVKVTRPMRKSGTKLFFEHDKNLIFDAGNEYRRMEIVSTTFPGMGVADIEYINPVYNMTLYTDLPRAGQDYLYDSTQHGRFLIREYNSTDSDVQADYVMTRFSLEAPRLYGSEIFLDGDFVSRRFAPESLMVWNNATSRYENAMLLKQGAYNYQYLTVPIGSSRGNTSTIEGDNYETVNEYEIRVYYRQPGARFDRLAAVTTVTSGR